MSQSLRTRWEVVEDGIQTDLSQSEVGKDHGRRGSTKAHNEILKIIDSAPDYESFVRELNEWASKRMKNGVLDLPEGLRR